MSSTPSSPPGSEVGWPDSAASPTSDDRRARDNQPDNPPDDRPAAAAVAAGDPDAEATIAELRARVEFLEQEWRRALADADNMRKRYAAEIGQIRDRERAEAARRWLPVIDDLDRALEHVEADPGSIVEGVRAIRDEALGVLADLGFSRRDDTGEPFDPARHDAIASRPGSAAPPGTVLQVVRPGYGSADQQLRPASVVVAEDS